MNVADHWSFKLSNPDAALPRGSFYHHERAEEYLRPISSLHREEKTQSNKCVCFRCAGSGIQTLAVTYNSNNILNRNAPRAKDVVLQVEAVRDCAQELLTVILSLDDYARNAFYKFGGSGSLDLPIHAGCLNDYMEEDPKDSECEWVRNLDALIDAANATSRGFKRSRGAGSGQLIDRGGNTNLYKQDSQSPDFNLVVDGWRLFERFRPNEAKGTEGGSFHLFLQCIYEYATGLEGEQYSGLSTWIKVLAGPLREMDDLSANRAALICGIENLAVHERKPRDEQFRDQLEAIDRRVLLQERVISQAKPGKKPQRPHKE
jgi:hypothetical protein